MQKGVFVIFAISAWPCLSDCVIYPVTSTPEYAAYVDKTHYLNQDCTLWRARFLPNYHLDGYWSPGSTWEGMVRVGDIPKGTPVTVRTVLRTRQGIIGSWSLYIDSAIVSIRQPGRWWPVRASLSADHNWYGRRESKLSRFLDPEVQASPDTTRQLPAQTAIGVRSPPTGGQPPSADALNFTGRSFQLQCSQSVGVNCFVQLRRRLSQLVEYPISSACPKVELQVHREQNSRNHPRLI